MGESVLSVCWKGYIGELSSEYKSLLDNNFLVDCTISAEGQRLKAHRLVLSACSPYFHMLFQEETGNHPFVILLNASFETLKAVIDFVYLGETQVPERNLKAFLTLAQSLQIKGLNAFTQDYNNKIQSSNTTENVQDSFENNQVTREVQDIDDCHEESLGNYTQQDLHFREGCTDTVHVNSSVPVLAFNASENRNERLDNVQSYEPWSANFRREMDVIPTSACNEDELNMFSSCNDSSLGNVVSSQTPPAPQKFVEFKDEVSFGGDITERGDSFSPDLVLKRELLDDEDIEERMDDNDVLLNETNEGTEHVYREQNHDQSSSADGLPLEEDLATQWRSLPGQQSESSPPHTELQLQEGPHAHPGEQTVLSEEDEKTETNKPSPRKRGRPKKGHFNCDVCGKSFPNSSGLARHKHTHTAERPHRCDAYGKEFSELENRKTHMRSHTGERPYRCDVCGKAFSKSGILKTHMRCHSGERPYRCDVCSKRFLQSSHLHRHMRCHTGERPYRCDVCGADGPPLEGDLATQRRILPGQQGKSSPPHTELQLQEVRHAHPGEQAVLSDEDGMDVAHLPSTSTQKPRCTGKKLHSCETCEKTFTHSCYLDVHKRIHTGERPYQCDVCSKRFVRSHHLQGHMRCHTGERPYQCYVCSKRFIQPGTLQIHMRYHTGERPYRCDVCGKTFTTSAILKNHMRCHTGERPYSCDVCGTGFSQSSTLNRHMLLHTGERPYCCDLCGKRYIKKYQLVTHVRTHIGI